MYLSLSVYVLQLSKTKLFPDKKILVFIYHSFSQMLFTLRIALL